MNKLHLSREKKLFGVCGGVAEFFDLDPTIIRIIWMLTVLVGGTGILAYLVCWLIMPPAEN